MRRSAHRAVSSIASAVILVIIGGAAIAGATFYVSQAPSSSTQTTQTGSTGTKGLINFTFGFNGPPDVTDTPGFVLWQYAGAQNGLNIIPSYWGGTTNTNLLFHALDTGTIDAAELAPDQVITADQSIGNSSGHFPYTIFGAYEPSLDYAFVVSNSIKNWSQLAGQPVAANRPTATSGFVCFYEEAQHGIPAAQQNCGAFGGETARAGALLTGKAVGAILEPFNTVKALQTGNFHILDTISNVMPWFMFETFYTTTPYLQAHPDILTKFMQSALLADRVVHNETQFIKWELQSFPGSNVTQVATAWKIWMGMNFWDPNQKGFTLTALSQMETYLVSLKRMSAFTNPSFVATSDIVNAALKASGSYTGPTLGYNDPRYPPLNITIPGLTQLIPIHSHFAWGGTGFLFALPFGAGVTSVVRRRLLEA